MAIYNIGSINIDRFYRLPHLPLPGETLAAEAYTSGLGGKGANQSVAAARAGSKTYHIGAIGADGDWCKDRLSAYGVLVDHIETIETPTGHANIYVDATSENSIVLLPGANHAIGEASLEAALQSAVSSDTLILQNETNASLSGAKRAKAKGMRVVYSAAPFDAERAKEILPFIDILILNEIEAEQLQTAMNVSLSDLDVPAILTTRGKEGVSFYSRETHDTITASAFSVEAVDSTGAGDCFAGYFAASLDQGEGIEAALNLASAAAAIQVTQLGTSDVIPTRETVLEFLKNQA